jgi:hypothetical protein
MIPLGLGLAWAGYTLGIWGYCLVRGYDVTFMQLFARSWPGTGKTGRGPAGPGSASPSSGGTTAPYPGMPVPPGGCPKGYLEGNGKCYQEAAN